MESEGGSKPRKRKPSQAAIKPGSTREATPRKAPTRRAPSKKPGPAEEPRPPAEDNSRQRILAVRIAIVAVAALAVVIGVLIAGGEDEKQAQEGVSPGAPQIVSAAELRSIAATKGTPIYWAGEQPGSEIELTEEAGGSVYVRYLEGGADPGESAASSLTVGTYPQEDPEGQLRQVAAGPAAIVRKAADGRQVISSKDSPYNVYFASPDNTVQVEVYDPSPNRAMELALSGAVQPVG